MGYSGMKGGRVGYSGDKRGIVGMKGGRVGYSGCRSIATDSKHVHFPTARLPPYRLHVKMDPGAWAHLSHSVQGCKWTGHKVSTPYPGLCVCLERSHLTDNHWLHFRMFTIIMYVRGYSVHNYGIHVQCSHTLTPCV